jgi:hypothetical protein
MARIVTFDKTVRMGEYPSRSSFSVDYGVSERTLARDIEYLRDRLEAPLEYDLNRRGYYYSKPWGLPSVITISAKNEDPITSLIEQLKVLSDLERDFVIKSTCFHNCTPSNEPSSDPRSVMVA